MRAGREKAADRLESGMWSVLICALLGSTCCARATDLTWTNVGNLSTPPVIDAVNVINYGTMNFNSSVYFKTSSTLNFSNLVNVAYPDSGYIQVSPGWQFDWEPVSIGQNREAENFYNDNLGMIYAADLGISTTDPFPLPSALEPSKLIVWSTNIVNHGQMIVGANGSLDLTGSNVDLSHGTLAVIPASSQVEAGLGGGLLGGTNYVPDVGIYDEYWVLDNFSQTYPLNSAGIWNGTVASGQGVPSPPSQPMAAPPVTVVAGPNNADSYINEIGRMPVALTNSEGQPFMTYMLPTNIVKGAVFVGTNPYEQVQIGFTPSTLPTNYFNTAAVLLSVSMTNPVQTSIEPLKTQTAYLYFRDVLASAPGRTLLKNVLTQNTSQPTNYYLSRLPLSPGNPGNNGYPEPNFFVDSGASNNYVQLNNGTNDLFGEDQVTNAFDLTAGTYSGYEAFIDNLVSRIPNVPGSSDTNLPGRIRIVADRLNLANAHIRGQGDISIQTPQLVSSKNAVIDCENLNYNLSSTNKPFVVQNLVGPSVERLHGYLSAWSATWDATAYVVFTNNFSSTNSNSGGTTSTNGTGGGTNSVGSVTNWVQTPITNTVHIGFHALVLDASQLTRVAAVNVQSLHLHSTNIVLKDSMQVGQSLLIDGTGFTLDGSLTLTGAPLSVSPIGGTLLQSSGIMNWVGTNAPNVLYFTNNGTLSVGNEAHFGDDRSVPYSDFVNNGTVSAESINLDSDYINNEGTLSSVGPLFMQARTAKLQDGLSTSGGMTWLSCDNLKFRNYQLTSHGQLYFDSKGSLYDAGAGSGNMFICPNGFDLVTYPTNANRGDLLGSQFVCRDPSVSGTRISFLWAAEDRGSGVKGYVNNEAVGRVVLTSDKPNTIFDFSGVSQNGETNGLYIDDLDLSGLADFTNQLQINPNLEIYFAKVDLNSAVKLPVDNNGIQMEPEEYVQSLSDQGKFDGHLHWDSGFAGPYSGVAVVITNCDGTRQSIRVNAALRNSLRIDSDGDGIPNGLDPYPFNNSKMGLCPIGLDTNSLYAASSYAFVSITTPLPDQSVNLQSVPVQGTAGGPSGHVAVYYQVNQTGWNLAASSDGGATWSGNAKLQPGQNVVQAYAVDPSGNTSLTQSIHINYQPGATKLQLIRQSDGSYLVSLSGQINQQYVLQTSTNLLDWQDIATNTATDGSIGIPLPGSLSNKTRFYRAKVFSK